MNGAKVDPNPDVALQIRELQLTRRESELATKERVPPGNAILSQCLIAC